MQHDLRARIAADVPRGTLHQLDAYVALLVNAASQQNLIAPSTIPEIWNRHVADAWQLVALADPGEWLDIGSGAGLPGLIIAIVTGAPITLVEPRTKRADFLRAAIETLGLGRAAVVQSRIEALATTSADILCARAVAPLDRLFAMAEHLARPETTWVLPKGRRAADELAAVQATWQGEFRLVPSQTDSSASIVVAHHVRRRKRR